MDCSIIAIEEDFSRSLRPAFTLRFTNPAVLHHQQLYGIGRVKWYQHFGMDGGCEQWKKLLAAEGMGLLPDDPTSAWEPSIFCRQLQIASPKTMNQFLPARCDNEQKTAHTSTRWTLRRYRITLAEGILSHVCRTNGWKNFPNRNRSGLTTEC